ncbi:hypothetical protein B0H67DRAFT_681496 [Lasiosphaeris hirsuta]|uniref:Uncharacterized protein n=1 Tax=Lasiosphaeris hirsuta TaxID=260670 RepID=A0AA40DXM1_9PEZI|nr:hypothetical protein B0H67DRAFT_681496 [Lasiosphaeris hirsuta]
MRKGFALGYPPARTATRAKDAAPSSESALDKCCPKGSGNRAQALEFDPEFDSVIDPAAGLLPVAASLRYAAKMLQIEHRLRVELECIDKEEMKTLGNSLFIEGEAKTTWAEVVRLRAETRGGRRPGFLKQLTERLEAKFEIKRAAPPGSWRSAQAGDFGQCREEIRAKYQAEREQLQEKYLWAPKGIEKKVAERERARKIFGGTRRRPTHRRQLLLRVQIVALGPWWRVFHHHHQPLPRRDSLL